MADKTQIEEKASQLIEMTADFCDEHANAEYRELCELLIRKMARKRSVPFLSGRVEIWAAAVVHALATINFLYDKSLTPHTTFDVLANHFGVVKSTVTAKAKVIRDMLKMEYFDDEFSTEHMKQNNPYANLVSLNGFIVDIENLPPEMREELRKRLES
jgi:hypothetical protein